MAPPDYCYAAAKKEKHMYKLLAPLAILFVLSLNHDISAQNTLQAPGVPHDVGTTTMPPGRYSVIEQNTGKKYSLMVTTKGAMILSSTSASTTASTTTATTAPPAAPNNNNSDLKGQAQSRIQKEVNRFIQKQGTNQLKNFIK
jgi:hypothetical protein